MTYRRFRRPGVMVLTAAALVVGLAACGGESGSASAPGQASSHRGRSITVGLSVTTPDYVPVYLAEDKGLWKKEGLDVKVVTFAGGSDLVKGVVSGTVDVGLGALPGVLTAVEQRQPLKVFYDGFNMTEFQWYAKPGIASVTQGRGKRWGVTKVGSSTDFLTRYVLNKNGLDPMSDVKIVQAGSSAARLAAMESHQLDVSLFTAPYTLQAKERGYKLIVKQSDLMDGYPTQVSFARQDFLEQHPDTVGAFLRGLASGMTLTHDAPKVAQQEIVKKVKIDPALAAPTYQSWIHKLYPDGRLPSSNAMDVFWQIGIENGQFKQRIPRSKWLYPKWIDTYSDWMK